MSTIDMNNNHSVTSYTAGVTKPLTGQRLSVLFWKTGKDGIKKDSKAVSIPKLVASDISPEQQQQLIPSLLGMLETVQNKIIREQVEEKNVSTILGQDISVAACIKWLADNNDSDGNGERLTKDSISQWFDTVVADKLMVAISIKLGIGDMPSQLEAEKVEKIVAAYKDNSSKLASGAFKLQPAYAEALKKAIGIAVDDVASDPVASKLVSKLDKMLTVTEDDLMMSL